jgi:hypothetical protein
LALAAASWLACATAYSEEPTLVGSIDTDDCWYCVPAIEAPKPKPRTVQRDDIVVFAGNFDRNRGVGLITVTLYRKNKSVACELKQPAKLKAEDSSCEQCAFAYEVTLSEPEPNDRACGLRAAPQTLLLGHGGKGKRKGGGTLYVKFASEWNKIGTSKVADAAWTFSIPQGNGRGK